MKIYLYFNQTTNKTAVTACEWTALEQAARHKKKGDTVKLYCGNLRTQGKNFEKWADEWREINIKDELPF